MEIFAIQIPHLNFYNPATGEQIVNELTGYNEKAKSLKAYWIDEIIESPFISDETLAETWSTYYEHFLSDEDSDEEPLCIDELLEKFLLEYDADENWFVFKVQCKQYGCGEYNSTVWYVLDLSELEAEILQ